MAVRGLRFSSHPGADKSHLRCGRDGFSARPSQAPSSEPLILACCSDGPASPLVVPEKGLLV